MISTGGAAVLEAMTGDGSAAADDRRPRQAALAEVARQALEEARLPRLFEGVVGLVAEGLGVSHVAVLRFDEASGRLTCRAQVGWRPEAIRPVAVTPGSQVGRTYLEGAFTVVDDYASDDRFPESRHLAENGIASGVTAAIRGREGPIGVLVCHSTDRRAFSEADAVLLGSVADVLAAAAARIEADERREAASERLERLQAVTARLAGAGTEQEVVEVILGAGVSASGACDGLIGLVEGEDVVVRASVGYPSELIDEWRRFPIADALPLSDVVRTGEAAYCASEPERDARWPSMAGLNRRPSHAFAALPLIGRSAALGGLALGFPEEREFAPEDRDFLETLARQCGQALERTRAQAAQVRASERLAFLADASRVLNSSLDFEETLGQVARLAVPRLADWYIVVLREGETLRQVSLVHPDPAKVEWAERLSERYGSRLDDETGVAQVIRSREAMLVPAVTDEMLVAAAHDEEHLEALRRVGMNAVMIVPLQTATEVLGAISFVAAESHRSFNADDLALAQDLAARVATAIENALLHRAERRRANAAHVLDRVADGVFEVAPDGTVRLWNQAAVFLTGIDARDAIGRAVTEVLPNWETITKEIDLSLVPGATRERRAFPFEIGGQERWLELTGIDHGEGAVYAFRDITRERDLEQAQRDFIATASHELRTPLAAIYGAAVTIAARDLDEPRRRQLIEIIAAETERLTRIVGDLLLANTLEGRGPPITLEAVSVDEVIDDVVAARESVLPDSVTMRVELDVGRRAVADRQRLHQVLTNLLDNAIKYSPNGGTITISTRARRGAILLEVSDEGLGIPYGEQEMIFERFYRLDPQQTQGVGGTGLGLYISRELVKRMNGHIALTSRVGKGSTFTVELPDAGRQRGGASK